MVTITLTRPTAAGVVTISATCLPGDEEKAMESIVEAEKIAGFRLGEPAMIRPHGEGIDIPRIAVGSVIFLGLLSVILVVLSRG